MYIILNLWDQLAESVDQKWVIAELARKIAPSLENPRWHQAGRIGMAMIMMMMMMNMYRETT